MEQSDLAQFCFYEADYEDGTPGYLVCGICNTKKVKEYEGYVLGTVPNLLALMEDAAEHYAAVHRKTDET